MIVKKRKKISKLHIFLSKDRNVAIFSIVIALLLWIVVSYNGLGDSYSSTTVKDIPITINSSAALEHNLNLKYTILDSNSYATVEISGRNVLINAITNEDIIVMADVSDIIAPGSYEVKLKAVDMKGLDYIISKINPTTVKVIATRQ